MLVDAGLREQLHLFCKITKQTQERAANQALREMLERCDKDPTMKARMDRVKELEEALANL